MAKGIASVLFGAALLVGGVASADPDPVPELYLYDGSNVVSHQHPTGSWLDFGLMYGRVEPTAGTTMSTKFFRFGPRASLNRFFYIGGEVDIGTLSAVGSSSQNDLARTASGEMEGSSDPMASVTGGTLAAGKALVGAHILVGPLSGAAEAAAGVRDFMTHDTIGQYKEGYFGGAYELHGRLDLWATRTLTVGALANVDLSERNDVSIGLVVGLHFVPYDGQRRW